MMSFERTALRDRSASDASIHLWVASGRTARSEAPAPRARRLLRAALVTLPLLLSHAPVLAQQGTPPATGSTPVAAPAQKDVPDIQMTVFAYPDRREEVAISYPNQKPTDEQVRKDVGTLAQALGMAAPRVKINPPAGKEGFVTAEAELTGLTNWSNGQINVDAVVHTFRRVKHLQVFLLFSGTIPLPPAGERDQPPLRIRTQPAGSGVVFDVWIDQSKGTPEGALSVRPADGSGFLWLAVGGTLLVLGLSALLIWYVVVGQKRRPPAHAVSHANEGK